MIQNLIGADIYNPCPESLLDSPKLTNLLKSENTSLLASPLAPPSSLASPVSGRLGLLPPGLIKLLVGKVNEAVEEGSMSRDVRNEVLSSSDRVDVIVRNASRRSF